MAQNGTASPTGNIASLHDKVALITGASSGLGRAIACAYAAAGAYIVSADITPNPPKAPTIAGIHKDVDMSTPTVELVNRTWPAEKGKERASFVKCDVTDEESMKAAVAFAVQRYGRLDVMVNNAGVFFSL
jgi:NAD(P)-dependent dehydrogenase (short-subunit alcohol dehydrogenase family)